MVIGRWEKRCVYERKKIQRKRNGGNENDRQGKKKRRGRSFPECFLPRMTLLSNFIRSKGAHRESGLERLAWFRNIVG